MKRTEINKIHDLIMFIANKTLTAEDRKEMQRIYGVEGVEPKEVEEKRWSLLDDELDKLVYYWNDKTRIFCIDLNELSYHIISCTEQDPIESQRFERWITEEEAKEILLELFWKKYPNGKFKFFVYNEVVDCTFNKGDEIFINDNRVGMENEQISIPFLDLSTGKWAEEVEDDPQQSDNMLKSFEEVDDPVGLASKIKNDVNKIIESQKVEFNNGICQVDCNCIEVAESKNGGEPVKDSPCLNGDLNPVGKPFKFQQSDNLVDADEQEKIIKNQEPQEEVMSAEKKEILILSSRYETMNKYVDLSSDEESIKNGIAKAMQEYAEKYAEYYHKQKSKGQSEQLKCPNCKLDYSKEEIEMFRGLCESCRDRAF